MAGEWSPAEKKIARKVFDAALQNELAEVMRKFKSMALSASEPSDIWATEEFLSEARRGIDRKYDYRYSQLLIIFAGLLREGRITIEDLEGLSAEKVDFIQLVVAR